MSEPSPTDAPAGTVPRPRRTSPLLRLVGATGAELADDTADDLVAYYMAAADADNTTRTYASAWRGFAAWCDAHGHTALPATPRTVARYLAVSAADTDRNLSKDTLTVWRAAIARVHADAGLPDPTADATVAKALRGIRRLRTKAGEAPDQAPPMLPDALTTIVTHIHDTAETSKRWRHKVAARRDIALLVLLYAAAQRRGEALALRLGDLEVVAGPDPDRPRLRIRLRGSKSSQTAVEHLYLERGTGDALVCPWCALIRWQVVLSAADEARSSAHARFRAAGYTDDEMATGALAEQITDAASIAVQRLLRTDTADPHVHRCHEPWPAPHRARAQLFRAVSNGGIPHDIDRALTGQAAARMINARSLAAGTGPARGHSPRAGMATFLYDNGATDAEVGAKLRHARPETSRRYDRHAQQRAAELETGL
ncbi:hypothetical protein [Nocardia sp. NPDC004722]